MSKPNKPGGTHTKLTKNGIQFIKDLQKSRTRQQTSSFLAEGRRTVETIFQSGARPLEVIMTQDSYDTLSSMLDNANISHPCTQTRHHKDPQDSHSQHDLPTTKSSFDQNNPLPDLSHQPPSIHQQLIDGVSCIISPSRSHASSSTLSSHTPAPLSQSTKTPWAVDPRTQSFTPPSIVEGGNHLTREQITCMQYLTTHAQLVESSLMGRLSTFSTAPGLLCRFPFLPNISMASQGSSDQVEDIEPGSDSDAVDISKHPLYKPLPGWNWSNGGIVLTSLNNPGNVGAILRTSHAFGMHQVLLVDSCDVYQPKTVAASMGAIAGLSITATTGTSFVSFLHHCRRLDHVKYHQQQQQQQHHHHSHADNRDLTTSLSDLATSASTSPYLIGLIPSKGYTLSNIPLTYEELIFRRAEEQALSHDTNPHSLSSLTDTALHTIPLSSRRKPWIVIGSESHGIPPQIEDLLTTNATITMHGDTIVGSLNATVAASIAIHELSNRLYTEM